MPVSTRLIRGRIKSVANTRKITKAMEMVAAAKMRKAIQLTLASREYARTIRQVVAEVSGLVDPNAHPLLAGRPVAKRTIVAIASSDRGMCGSFNTQLLRKALDFIKTRTEEVAVVTIGKRAEQAIKRVGYPILAAFGSISDSPSFERTTPMGSLLYEEFKTGRADRVFIAYTDFKNALVQIPTIAQLLPIIHEADLPKVLAEQNDRTELEEPRILFEPDAPTLLDTLLPRLLETQVYQSLLESAASEQSARNTAMHNATDNATNMLNDLTLTFNQARQAMITREISEISAGKSALE